jgi:hypothetical protein
MLEAEAPVGRYELSDNEWLLITTLKRKRQELTTAKEKEDRENGKDN